MRRDHRRYGPGRLRCGLGRRGNGHGRGPGVRRGRRRRGNGRGDRLGDGRGAGRAAGVRGARGPGGPRPRPAAGPRHRHACRRRGRRGPRARARRDLDRVLDLAAAYRHEGRIDAALDACYLALSISPDDLDLHLALVELYDDRGWRGLADEKLDLLDRLAAFDEAGEAAARVGAARSLRG
jgi:tetratricopeptide (TPR) repeat protein